LLHPPTFNHTDFVGMRLNSRCQLQTLLHVCILNQTKYNMSLR
jgi:hypothetical protein